VGDRPTTWNRALGPGVLFGTPLVGDGVLQSVDTTLGGVRLVESVAIKGPQMTVRLIKTVKATGEETPERQGVNHALGWEPNR
jgi:hypothetical protein